jgi:N-acetylglucosamine malate deacetylase 1
MSSLNVLVIAPHPDDESIGCGGTVCVHAGRGDRVTAAFLSSGEAGLTNLPPEQARLVRERESREAAAALGMASVNFLRLPDGHLGEGVEEAAAALRPILEREQPLVIYLAHERDWHPDHRACLPIVQTALRSGRFPAPRLLCYEILTPLTEYDCVEDITPVMPRKLKAVRAHRSQVRQLRYDLAARALNEYRGAVAQAGRYAEVFTNAGLPFTAVSRERRSDPAWHRVYRIMEEIATFVPSNEALILVDEARLNVQELVAPRRCIPFLEQNECYGGKPADDDIAIRELTRLKCAGATFMVFTWPALWWLEHYSGLARYLYSNFQCVRKNGVLVAFDLRQAKFRSMNLKSQEQVCGS